MNMTPQQASALAAAEASIVALTEAHRVLRASLADPVPAPPPPVEPPAPLPPNVQVAPGNDTYSRQYNWAADSVDVSRLARAEAAMDGLRSIATEAAMLAQLDALRADSCWAPLHDETEGVTA